jgi:hypothetical protein
MWIFFFIPREQYTITFKIRNEVIYLHSLHQIYFQMKKNVLFKTIFVALMICYPMLQIFAVRAYPGLIKIKQANGYSLTIRNHGDEFQHYTTTEDKFLIKQNAKGLYTYASIDAQGDIVAGPQLAKDASVRPVSDRKYLMKIPEKLTTVSSRQISKANLQRQNITAPRKAYPLI